MKTWGVADSLKLYNIENWGDEFFNINPTGNLTVYPKQGLGPGIDLKRVVEDVKKRNLGLPVLIRFQDIIRHRVIELNETFRKVIKEANYKGNYQGVYPVKVNQLREVIEEILDAGQDYNYGLEAGSKAELTAVVSMDLPPDALVICNGYKDYDFIRIALLGAKFGKNVIIVVEKLSELKKVISVAKELELVPHIGIRSKLFTKGSGRWESSSGDSAKFGLTAPEILQAVRLLQENGLEDSLKLLHFHIGSQITDIRTIKDAVNEATRLYSKLQKMGLGLKFLDVGGGLGVDYDGSKTNFQSSTNYTISEYVSDIVYTVQEICRAEGVPEPTIVSESGRAVVAHHSALIVDVFGDIQVGRAEAVPEEVENETNIVGEMRYILENISNRKLLEHYHDAVARRDESLNMFKLGILSLEDLSKTEVLFWNICKKIKKMTKGVKYVPDEIEDLRGKLSDQYLCNFSVFQSMLDHWAIQHLFPIIPIHRLDEEPTREATLADITCDSDGKVTKFIDLRDIRDTLRVHPLRQNEPYYLGFFLMGAYQDIMGDLHNLFGRVNEVHVFLDETEPGGYYIEEVIKGSSIAGMLSWTQYSTAHLIKGMKNQIDQKVKDGSIKPREGAQYLKYYESVLAGYTYLDPYKNEVNITSLEVNPLTTFDESNSDALNKEVH